MSSKNKKQANITDLDRFLAKESFTVKEEQDIWSKFGNIIGSGHYFICRYGNRATITSRGIQYHYLVKQNNDINSPSLYLKISDISEWGKPENKWNFELLFDVKTASWRTPEPCVQYTPEEDALSIIESVVMSSWKSYRKALDYDDTHCNLFLEQTDFCYTYIGQDRKWHAFYPSLEKLISYAEKFNKIDFIQFLNSEECYWHREFWNLT